MNNQQRGHTYNIKGNFNQSVSIGGDNLQIYGDYVNNNQDLSQVTSQIQDLLTQLEKQGYSSQDAQKKVADDWINEAQNNPNAKSKLVKLGKYIGNAGADAVIGEAILNVIALVFRSLGIPLPF